MERYELIGSNNTIVMHCGKIRGGKVMVVNILACSNKTATIVIKIINIK